MGLFGSKRNDLTKSSGIGPVRKIKMQIAIGSIVALIIMVAQSYGIEIPKDMLEEAVGGAMAIIVLIGYFTKPKKNESQG